MFSEIEFFFAIAILIMSVVIHEVSHGFSANALGDPTARLQGRLTLNPLKHLDPIGSIIVPATTYLIGGFIFGWARPVPYNPYNLKNQKWGPGAVAAAGPLANILIAIIFGLIIRFGAANGFISDAFLKITASIVFINIILAVFNLIPIPPLDGSKVFFALLPYRWRHLQIFLEQYGFFILLIFIFFFWSIILPIVFGLFQLITGLGF
ncbi:MAG: site-2 protease family protein [Candidatus Niyogibacteria bacterium]|jgi:Zn-dependent protease|nr:site-2 protease family protein [Candidatus Niyogibacteria bacterium]